MQFSFRLPSPPIWSLIVVIVWLLVFFYKFSLMRLFVKVIEARGLPIVNGNGQRGPYVKVQLGKQRSKTSIVKESSNPFWEEEFDFRVGDLSEEIRVSILYDDKCIGYLKLPLSEVFNAENLSLGTIWYQLRQKSKKSKNRVCGEICLAITFSQKRIIVEGVSTNDQISPDDLTSSSDKSVELFREQCSSFCGSKVEYCDDSTLSGAEEIKLVDEDKSNGTSFVGVIRQVLVRKSDELLQLNEELCTLESENTTKKPEICEHLDYNSNVDVAFDELLKAMQSKEQGYEVAKTLSGGILIDQSYMITPCNLNSLLFSSGSEFAQTVAELQGTSELKIEAWKAENGGSAVKRMLTYRKAASKIVKALRAKEEQVYLKVDGKCYSVLASVSVPDAPFGNYFKTEILYCITPELELPSDDQSSRLTISWRINFLQSTIMKGMIESGAKQGLNESFNLFADTLSKYVEPLEVGRGCCNKEQILDSLQAEPDSFWKLLYQFYGNFHVLFFVMVALYVVVHMLLATPKLVEGLEFVGLDLPDSISELLFCVVLVLQGQSITKMTRRYLHALKLRGANRVVKGKDDGWLLTVALIEGSNLAKLSSSGLSDPYVILTCNGQKRTSSIKFQTLNPLWNDVLEFDAMCEPPSRMDIVVCDFDGPFDEAISLGNAEVNFLKSNLSELSDVWVPLQGKFSQACQSKLHLKIFLKNSKGSTIVMEYLTKMEKEVGKKINMRSPQTNSMFQKQFDLPPEEFLIDDFTCQLKRKMPLQGRLFLSPRIFGFYANLFGNKTKFFFLWDDIEDIQVVPPSLASVGSPSLLIILCKGRGMDAKHGAKGMDQKGRLKFHFQSFVSFNAANRTIMALWKTKSTERNGQTLEAETKTESLQPQDNESFQGLEEVKMLEVCSSSLSISANQLMEAFEGGLLEQKIVEKSGRLEHHATPWEEVKCNVHQRQVSYKFDKSKFRYEGEVNSIQKRHPLTDGNGWVVEESMSLQGVLLSDCFSLQFKYQVENSPTKPLACTVQVLVGIVWLKSTKHQKRIIKSVTSNTCLHLKEMFRQVEKELSQDK